MATWQKRSCSGITYDGPIDSGVMGYQFSRSRASTFPLVLLAKNLSCNLLHSFFRTSIPRYSVFVEMNDSKNLDRVVSQERTAVVTMGRTRRGLGILLTERGLMR